MRCKFCGTTLPDHAKFCPGCGKEIDNDRERHESREASNIPEDAYYTKVIEENNEKTIDNTRVARANNGKAIDDTKIARANNRNGIDDTRIARANNRNVIDDTRIARANNKNAIENTKRTNKQAAPIHTNKKNSKGKRRRKKISVRFIIVYLIVVLTGGFCLYRMGFPEKVVEMFSKQSSVADSKKEISQKSDKKKSNEKKTGKATTEEKKKDKTENKNTVDTTESTLAYTDNSSMNVGACLSPEDYNTVTAKDDSFSFAYPKYLFNYSEENADGTSYTFSYKGKSGSNEAELSVYTQENEGDPLQNARELYQNFSSEVYKKYFKMYPSRVDSSGMARTLIGASTDSSEKTGVYIIAANDGKRDYILKFTYPDPDMTNDYNEIDYVVDCVYRFCSFSGGTYQPRSYQQFLDDNMGSKK